MNHVIGSEGGHWFCNDCQTSCTSDNPCDCCDIAQALEDDYPLDTEQDPLR